MPLPALAAGAARMAASGATKQVASGAAKQAASGAVNKTIAQKSMGGFGGSSPATLANKTAGNSAMFSESQQEIALRMSRSEIANKEAMRGDSGQASPTTQQTEDPIQSRISEQLEIRRAQQKSAPDDEGPSDEENSQEKALNQSKESARTSIASMAPQAGETLKDVADWVKKIRKIWGICALLFPSLPVIVALLLILMCLAIVLHYIDNNKISGGYNLITGQFEELLMDAVNHEAKQAAIREDAKKQLEEYQAINQ